MSRLRGPRAVLLAAGAILVLGLLWAGWTAWQVNADLANAVRHAERIQSAVVARDSDAMEREVAGLRTSSRQAAERTSGPTWGLLTRLPFVGDDAAGVRTTSVVLADLADDGVEPLVAASDRFEQLLPRGGAVDQQAVADVAEPVHQARVAFGSADDDLAQVDPSGFVGRLEQRFRRFRDQVSRASDALASAETAARVLPAMLGDQGARRHLVVFENNAEIRSTGGLAGAVSSVEATDGVLRLGRQVAGAALGKTAEPVLPLTAAEDALYGDVLGTYFVNATMTPDVPRAADLLRARWEQRFPGRPVDGVVLLDAVGIGYLLEATGPVVVDGIEITGDNAVEQLLHATYLRVPDPAAQDAFFAAVAAATFDRFTAGADDPTAILRALARAVRERRVFVHSFDAAVQQQLAGTTIAGELVTDPRVRSPQVGVTVDDMTGAKMSYYLRYDVDVTATTCRGSTQRYLAKARIRSVAPPDAGSLPDYVTGGGAYGSRPGTQLMAVRVFGPTDGSVTDVEFNGVPSEVIEADQGGRPVAMTYVQLAPGQSVDLAWAMESGPGQDGPTQVQVTPTIERKNGARAVESACAG
ncbi:DUF4012 domain-containing protein [Nocardioides nitrophenolicus]|uniref:DUF4012 domain-containing protein n=1 Tax=Nocardioides nitrophenolicus TaxID=60489 RepID=UPI00195E3A60|nr:DUF4012 domain-containing protein [Nocardioides nitrophenolicus]MBM7518704.1 hypothetical protein [Nocardioides nitrophenolicus]